MGGNGSRDPLVLGQPTNPCSRAKRCGPAIEAVQDPKELVAPVAEDGRRHTFCCLPGLPVRRRRFSRRTCRKAEASKDGARILRMRARPSASCEVHELGRRKLPSLDLDVVSGRCYWVGRRCAGHPQNVVSTDAVQLAMECEGRRHRTFPWRARSAARTRIEEERSRRGDLGGLPHDERSPRAWRARRQHCVDGERQHDPVPSARAGIDTRPVRPRQHGGLYGDLADVQGACLPRPPSPPARGVGHSRRACGRSARIECQQRDTSCHPAIHSQPTRTSRRGDHRG